MILSCGSMCAPHGLVLADVICCCHNNRPFPAQTVVTVKQGYSDQNFPNISLFTPTYLAVAVSCSELKPTSTIYHNT